MQDASIERYLEAAKVVADHAVDRRRPAGVLHRPRQDRAGVLRAEPHQRSLRDEGFSRRLWRRRSPVRARSVRQGVLCRLVLQASRGARRSDGDDSRARGEGRHHRPVCGHIWTVVNKPNTGYPTRETVDRWTKLPAPTSDVHASIAKARAGCDEIYKALTTWPSWFFARGDLGGRRRGRREPADLRRHDAEGRADAPLRLCHGYARRTRTRRACRRPDRRRCHLTFTDVNPGTGRDAGRDLAQPALVTRAAAARPRRAAPPRRAAAHPAGAARRRPVLRRSRCDRVAAAGRRRALAFGTSPDGTRDRPDDFATTGPVSFTIDVPAGGTVAGVSGRRRARQRQERRRAGDDVRSAPKARRATRLSASSSAIRRAPATGRFARNMAEYVALLPPNSHGEANPADKDPVPPPFDNTYNSPEHDAFVLKVKYQRNDNFFTDEHGRRRRSRAAESGLERSVRLVAVPRRVPGHAGRSLRPDAEEPSRSRICTPPRSQRCPRPSGPISRRCARTTTK